VGRHIGGQLTGSGTSAGANYEEACGAERRADFIHRLQVVLKELRESFYWLCLIKKTTLIYGY
jgi:four helix bundle protein